MTPKGAYNRNILDNLTDNNRRRVWQEIQIISNFEKSSPCTVHPKFILNHFFSCFEVNRLNTNTYFSLLITCPLTIQEQHVREIFRTVNTRKDPNKVFSKVLKICACARIFNNIFNISLTLAPILRCLKSATPFPKKPVIDSLNDYKLGSLTPVIISTFKDWFYTTSNICLLTFDPHLFVYRANRSKENTIALTFYTALSHLKLQLGFFNTIIPDIKTAKLCYPPNLHLDKKKSLKKFSLPPSHLQHHVQHWLSTKL